MSIEHFPDGFLWGTAISAFQVEMGRGKLNPNSDWYVWVHDEENITSGRVSGDFPEDGPGFQELYSEDLRRGREELGNNAIRLSIDWSNIFPQSTEAVEADVRRDILGNVFSVKISEESMKGLRRLADDEVVRRYRQILSEAQRLGLKAMLTLCHWPIPLCVHR